MRIIAGLAKGVPLKAPKGVNTRPTSDRVRESVFAILGDFSDRRVLDLFAGSGALGLEALSRGAVAALFLEKDRGAVQVIRDNIEKTRFTSQAQVLAVDTLKFLTNPARYWSEANEKKYDLVFIDPPYTAGLYTTVLAKLISSGLLVDHSIVVVETAKFQLPPEVEGFNLWRSERYGDTVVYFYRFCSTKGDPVR